MRHKGSPGRHPAAPAPPTSANGQAPLVPPTPADEVPLPGVVATPETTGMDWETIAKMAMQQRDRMAQHANNLELDLAVANLKIGKFEAKELGITVPELRAKRAAEVARLA